MGQAGMKRKPGTVYQEPGRNSLPALSTGDVVAGHYVVEELIDEGGMAVVYRATNMSTGRACALKILHAQLGDRPEFMRLFAKEAKVSSVIGDNDHIVQVYDAGIDEGRGIPFIVMELLEGETLERMLERGPLPRGLVKKLLEQLKSALDQAHRSGVVHRDLKPSNLFLTRNRHGEPVVKVMDFGIAKVLQGEAVRTATHIGTPAYNAPEQMGSTTRKLAAKQGITIATGVSPATDVWSLGLLAYEMFTGEAHGRYWGVETISELPMKVAFEELEPPSAAAGDRAYLLPPGFDEWFARSLRKNAAERYQSGGEAIAELLRILDERRSDHPAAAADEDEEEDEDVLDLDAEAAEAQAHTRLYQKDAGPTSQRSQQSRVPASRAPASRATPGSRRSASSNPPPLPRVSSPAITVAGSPALDPPRESQSTPPGVVKGSKKGGTARSKPPVQQAGPPKWAVFVAVGAVVLAIGGVVSLGMRKQAGDARACSDRGAISECVRACDGGALAGCVRAGAMYEKGDGAARDDAKARDLYRRGCGVADSPEPGKDPEGMRRWATALEKEGCREGTCVAQACAALGAMYEVGRGGAPKSEVAATALFKRTCQVDFDDDVHRGADGCVGLGRQRERAGEVAAARRYYEASCEGGLSAGCVALAGILERGDVRGEGRDEKKARTLYQKACDDGDLRGCTRLGSMVEHGRGGWVKDETAAIDLYKRSCDGGELLGCVHLGAAHLIGRGKLPKDAVRAAELYAKSCDGGELRGCATLAQMVLGGQGGLAPDEKRAFDLNKRACDGGELLGCANLGHMFTAGKAGLQRDAHEAHDLFDRACKGGEPAGCVALGRVDAASGKIVGHELVGLYERACTDGEPAGCIALGELYESGDNGVEQDVARAAQLYRQACDDGGPRGCTNLANLTYQGTGVERDAVQSVALNDRACKGGDRIGCQRLGLLYALGHGVEKDIVRAAEMHRASCGEPFEDDAMKGRCDMLKSYLVEKGEEPKKEEKAPAPAPKPKEAEKPLPLPNE
jgi:TPR repeat protein